MNDIGSPADGALEASTALRGGDDCRRRATRPHAAGRSTSSCCTGTSERGRRRSFAAWPVGSARTPRTCPARRSRSSRSIAGSTATLYHVDLYRLEPAEIDDLGLEDLVSGEGIVAIEWAERWKGRPGGSGVVEVSIEDDGDEQATDRGQGIRQKAQGIPSAFCLLTLSPYSTR